MANPYVRPHLRFLPIDTTSHASAFHGEKWRLEVDGNIASPMIRAPDGQDYFVDEPVLANVDSLGSVGPVWPTRFYIRDDVTFARVHLLRADYERSGYIIDGDHCMEMPVSAFILSYPRFAALHSYYNLPPPNSILGQS